MIKLTKFQGREFYLNSDLKETIEETPDTMITLTTSKKITVKETSEEVVEKVKEFRKEVSGIPRIVNRNM